MIVLELYILLVLKVCCLILYIFFWFEGYWFWICGGVCWYWEGIGFCCLMVVVIVIFWFFWMIKGIMGWRSCCGLWGEVVCCCCCWYGVVCVCCGDCWGIWDEYVSCVWVCWCCCCCCCKYWFVWVGDVVWGGVSGVWDWVCCWMMEEVIFLGRVL